MEYLKIGLIAGILLFSSTSSSAFAREGRGVQHQNFNREGGGNYNRNSEAYHRDDYNHYNRGAGYDRAYEAGWNQGSSSAGTTIVEPNTSLEELEEYQNPNSAANQYFRYNQNQSQYQVQ